MSEKELWVQRSSCGFRRTDPCLQTCGANCDRIVYVMEQDEGTEGHVTGTSFKSLIV